MKRTYTIEERLAVLETKMNILGAVATATLAVASTLLVALAMKLV